MRRLGVVLVSRDRRCRGRWPVLAWAGAALLAAVPAQAQVPAVEAGRWQVWVTGSASRPAAAPQAEHCLQGARVRDMLLYSGETPGDSSCQALDFRPAPGARGFTFRLACSGNEGGPVVVSQTDRKAFTARLERSPSYPRVRGPVHVHGLHVGACG